MKTIKPEHKSVLDRIQESVPKYLTESVVVKEKVDPKFIEVLRKGVKDEEFSKETRAKWKLILASGFLDKEIEKEDPFIAEEINAYIELEMAKAVIRKELPKPKKMEKYDVLFTRYNKIKQYNDKKYKRN